MTKKLESLFNLPDSSGVEEDVDPATGHEEIEKNKEILEQVNLDIDKIDAALPSVRDLDTADYELDELARLAQARFEDLMDLGMNVEARFSGTILQTAGVLLGHAITAKTAKIDKKLKMIDLQLKKAKLDQATAAKDPAAGAVEGKAWVVDRNELLQQLGATNRVKN